MSATLSRLEFRLADEVEGQPLTPQTVDLPTLRGFLEEVEKLIKGDVPGASLTNSRVRIEEGSVKVIALVSMLLAASLDSDLAKAGATEDLDQVQPRRAEVLATWQSRARRNPTRRYSVAGTKEAASPLTITSTTQLARESENGWFSAERYIRGKVVDMGGKQSPNVHVAIEGTDQTLTIAASELQLRGAPHLYQQVTLRVTAEQHVQTKELRNAHLLEFLPTSQDVDEGALERLWKVGRSAWHDVPNATSWVEEMRGH